MRMKNVYPNRKTVELSKLKEKNGIGTNCLAITILEAEGSGSNYHIKEDNFLDFVLEHYWKEVLKRLKIILRKKK